MEKTKSPLLGKAKARPGTLIALLVIAAVVAYMLQERYLSMILDYICIYTIAVTGLDILFGYTGQVSFGHAGFYAIGAYGSTLLAMNFGIPPIITIFLGAILAMLFGLLIAFPASRLVKHFLSLLTIAFGQMVYTFIVGASWLTKGPSGIINIPRITIFGIKFSSYQTFFWIALIIMLLVLLAKRNIIKSRIGRAFIAVRENPHAAAGMGINVAKYKIIAFGISAFMAGLAGALYAHMIGFISPDTFTNTQSNMFMTMLLFGGIATMTGSVVGATVITVITELLQSFASAQKLVYAFFILVVLFFLPNGAVGLWDKIRHTLKARRSQKKEAVKQ